MASEKLSGLTRANLVAATDLLYMVLNPGATPISRGVLLSDVLAGKIGSAEIKASIISGLTEEEAPDSGDFVMMLVDGALRKVDIGNMAGIDWDDAVDAALVPNEDSVHDLGSDAAAFAEAFISVLTLAGTSVDSIKDEDTMASDSASALVTQQSVKAYADLVRSVPEVSSFTVGASHLNKTTRVLNANPINVTLPADATAALGVGFKGVIKQTGAGQVSFEDDSGAATIRLPAAFNPKTAQQWSAVYYEKVAANTWEIVGDLELIVPAPNAQTGTEYELVLADINRPVTMDNAGENSVRLPPDASTDFPVGVRIPAWQLGIGETKISAATGVTLNGVTRGAAAISAQYKKVDLMKVASNAWVMDGSHGTVQEVLAVTHVKTTNTDAANNPSSATHNLAGSGSNRLIVAVVTGQDGEASSLSSITLDGVAGTVLGNFSDATAGTRDINMAVAYWLDTDHPGAGDQTLAWEWSGNAGSSRSTVMEFSNVDQSSPVSTPDTNTAEQVAADNLSLALSIADEAGGLGIVCVAGVDENNNTLTGDNQVHSCTNVDSKEEDDTIFSTGRAVWIDDEIASASESYTITAESEDIVELNWTAAAFALRAT